MSAEVIQQSVVPHLDGAVYVVTYKTGTARRYTTQVFDYSAATRAFTPLTPPHPRQYLPATEHVHKRLLRIWSEPFNPDYVSEREETGLR